MTTTMVEAAVAEVAAEEEAAVAEVAAEEEAAVVEVAVVVVVVAREAAAVVESLQMMTPMAVTAVVVGALAVVVGALAVVEAGAGAARAAAAAVSLLTTTPTVEAVEVEVVVAVLVAVVVAVVEVGVAEAAAHPTMTLCLTTTGTMAAPPQLTTTVITRLTALPCSTMTMAHMAVSSPVSCVQLVVRCGCYVRLMPTTRRQHHRYVPVTLLLVNATLMLSHACRLEQWHGQQWWWQQRWWKRKGHGQ